MRARPVLMTILLLTMIVTAQPLRAERDDTPAVTPEQKLDLGRRLLKALATVEITLQYDKGEAPHIGGSEWGRGSRYYGGSHYVRQFIEEERPMEQPGLALAADLLLVPDVLLHERFIERIDARLGDERVGATIIAWMRDQPAILVKLDRPLKALEPLVFDVDAHGPYLTATFAEDEAAWRVDIGSLGDGISVFTDGRQRRQLATPSLIVTPDGVGVGASFYDDLPPDDTWKASPADWPHLTRDQRATLLENIEQQTDAALPRVTLNFRSPSKSGDDFGAMMRRRMGGGFGGEEDAITEAHVPGIRINSRRVVVLATLDASATARLERIRVFDAQGAAHDATFVASLRDHGALIVELDEPMTGGMMLHDGDLRDLRRQLLPTTEVRIAGPQRIAYFNHDRLQGFELGWKRQLFPVVASDAGTTFLFDQDAKLLALPLVRRPRPSMEDRYNDGEPILTPAAHLANMISDLQRYADPNNIPLTEEEENRLAWMGIVLQPLDQDLARLNEVSDLTNDGQTGGLVTFVYPDSPAAKAGITPGQILLRLHVKDYPNPINIRLDEGFAGFMFPWDQLDQIPEEYFDQIPTPWPSVSNALNETLTQIGFGKPYEAEFIVDGQPVRKTFTVEQSPRHYASAEKFKSEALGLTVKNVTYEVAQYLRLSEDDPGIIVSKIEPGSPTSVAGVKPYELVTHVAGQPVSDVETFEKLIGDTGELTLSVKRMTRSRQVVIRSRN